ncbi:DivIVA domain-containing protein [Hymenobacter lutimineralis]|uniref:DivIVA domain-containing protein n=1 Tax=Hymenobacter lutimineralis TaxID=2606448 RepID=A0A5D6UQU1_9BACT|nr:MULTISPECIES: DivIVA domain-containing protein [Hymenobacter]QIX60770.1 DivIVA domain-containing protein [Hymenobacter sp. BT18]TYZ05803.1 DivIVA domain-containing protein [Hymenobacter lutimineralis]
MKISALDIRQKTFEKAFRGLDKDEVQAFLNTLSQQWERMGDENRELRLKLEHATQEVQKMREVESSLYRTLKTAEDTGNSITEQAQRDAELRVREAQLKAEQLLADARQKARSVVDDAYKQAEKTIAEMQTEVNLLGQEHQRLEGVLEGLVRDLQHLATDALDKVEKSRNRPKSSMAAILSRAASVKVNKPEPSPEADSAMLVHTSATSSAAAVNGARPSAPAVGATSAAERAPIGPQPGAYNPKPGQQPDPGAPAQTPGPDIQPNRTPDENPGRVDPSRIHEPGPATVPNPVEPRVEPIAPDIQPVGPGHPEITQPSPATHPGMQKAEAEKSFFDEI